MLLNLGVTRSTDQGEAKVKLVTKRQNELKSDFARFATHLQTVFLLLNKHFVRSLRATLACEHFKLCAHLLSSYGYYVSILSVVVLCA